MKTSLNPFDYLFLTRPILLFPIWIFYLAGVWSVLRFPLFKQSFTIDRFNLAVFFALSCIMGAVYVLNQLRDIETDRINGKKFLIATGHIAPAAGVVEAVVLIVTGFFFAYKLEMQICFVLFLILLFAGYLYNFPPFTWKDKPVMSLLTNGIGMMLIYVLGWVSQMSQSISFLHMLLYCAASLCVSLNTMLPDIEGDKKTGKITFAVRYGEKATSLWAFIFQLITLIGAFLLKEWLLFFPALMVTPFFVAAFIQKNIKPVLMATKISILALTVSVCLFFPLFTLLLLIVFFGTKLYYHKRFHFNYPSLQTN